MTVHFTETFYFLLRNVQPKHLIQDVMAVIEQILHLLIKFFYACPTINLCDTEYLFLYKP